MSNGLYICVYWLRLNVISEHASRLEMCSWMLYLNICQLLFYLELSMPFENESRDVLLWILLGMFNDGRNSFPQWLHLSDGLWHLFQWFLQPWALDAWMTGTVALCFTVKGDERKEIWTILNGLNCSTKYHQNRLIHAWAEIMDTLNLMQL